MNDMRKLIEAVEQLDENSSMPSNYAEVTATQDPDAYAPFFSVDWKADPDAVLIEVANAIQPYGLKVTLIDFSDDGYHFNISK